MNIYKLWVDECDYDEYDKFVIIAESEEDALRVLYAKEDYLQDAWRTDFFIKEIGIANSIEESIVCSSFNAG